MEMQYDVDFQHEALRHRQARFVVNREMPHDYKPSQKKGKANTRTLQYPLHQQPCAEGRSNFSRRGSNATREKLTCAVCGHFTAKRQVPRLVAS